MASSRSVVYVDLGFTTARQEWEEVGLPAYERFKEAPGRATAMDAAIHAWHVQDWIWHENNPGVDTYRNRAFYAFRDKLIDGCPELEWVGDIADASKHRGLGKLTPPQVQRMTPAVRPKPLRVGGRLIAVEGGKVLAVGGSPLTIELIDGDKREVAVVLKTVVDFWQAHFAGTSAPPSGHPA